MLKKISSLEQKDYVGKLDEEISQKLKVDSVEVQWQGHLEKVQQIPSFLNLIVANKALQFTSLLREL